MSLFHAVLKDVIHPAEERLGDYRDEKDGLLRCGVCHEKKEFRIQIFPDQPPSVVPVPCECMKKKQREEEAERKAREARDRIEAMRRQGLADDLYLGYTFADDDRRDEKASRIARRYVTEFDQFTAHNIGLMLYGEVGVGKSFLAGCIANALIDHGNYVLMSTVQNLVAEAGKDFNEDREEVFREIAGARLLILDDFGVERNTEYMTEQTYEIINARYKAKKPLIITTNLSPALMEQEKSLDKRRIYERIMEMCQTVRVNGGSRRMGIAQAKADMARKLLRLDEEDEAG